MSNRNIVITGANRGIGLEMVRIFHTAGDTVTAVCRKTSDDLQELGVKVIEGIDMGVSGTIASLAENFEPSSIDILFNNAGLRTFETFDDLNEERLMYQYRVNAIAPILVTRALADKLKDEAKVAMISTRAGSIGDNGSGGEYGYRMSKAALNMAGVNLSIDLQNRDIGVFMLHPGFVQTRLTDGDGLVTATESATKLVALTERLTLSDSGGFFHAEGDKLLW